MRDEQGGGWLRDKDSEETNRKLKGRLKDMYGKEAKTADIRRADKRRVNRLADNWVMNEEYHGIFLYFQERKIAKECKKRVVSW